jgi:hypothetical protein
MVTHATPSMKIVTACQNVDCRSFIVISNIVSYRNSITQHEPASRHLAIYACHTQFWPSQFSKWWHFMERNTSLRTFSNCRMIVDRREWHHECAQSIDRMYAWVFKILADYSASIDKNAQLFSFHFSWDGIPHKRYLSLSLHCICLHHRLLYTRVWGGLVKGY